MPEVLDQSEVDALLAAVDSGGDFSDLGGMGSPMGGDGGGGGGSFDDDFLATKLSNVSIYDFKRPERVSKDQLRALENLHEVFARNFGASLSGYLRTIIDVKLASVEQLTYSEFIMSLPSPTCFNLVSALPLEGEMILEINPSITYTIFERLLGAAGRTTSLPPERPLTDIELMLIKNVTGRAMEQLKMTWANIKDLDFQIVQTESNPQLMQIVAPNEPVVLISFEVSLGEITGMINLCIPFLVIEPITSEFSAQTWFGYNKQGKEDMYHGHIAATLDEARLKSSVVLAETTISVKDLLTMKKGDVLRTDQLKDAEIFLSVEGRNKFKGTSCIYRNMKALKITEIIEIPEK